MCLLRKWDEGRWGKVVWYIRVRYSISAPRTRREESSKEKKSGFHKRVSTEKKRKEMKYHRPDAEERRR